MTICPHKSGMLPIPGLKTVFSESNGCYMALLLAK